MFCNFIHLLLPRMLSGPLFFLSPLTLFYDLRPPQISGYKLYLLILPELRLQLFGELLWWKVLVS